MTMRLLQSTSRRQMSTHGELEVALDALERRPDRIRAVSWPGHFVQVDSAGLYAWWVDASGARDLESGLGLPIEAGRIYAGQTGATAWPSGTVRVTSLADRIGGNHLRGRIRGSTFRLTLAACLRRVLGFEIIGPRKMPSACEARLSDWMHEHLSIAVHPFPERDALAHLEELVLARVDPSLNLEGMAASPIRARISELRRAIRGASSTRG